MLLRWEDLALQISESLTDREKILLSMTSKFMDWLKHKFIFREKINMGKIRTLPYFDNFESIEITDVMFIVGWKMVAPKNVKSVYFKTHGTLIPSFVTHLTFVDHFNLPIDCISHSVTHLTFGTNFNQPIKNTIPKSVTHLIFGNRFNQSIYGHIPESVTHLTFGSDFNRSTEDALPESITHLTFGYAFNKSINECGSDSVTHLVFGLCFDQPINMKTVTHLTIGDFFSNTLCNMPSLTHLTFDCIEKSLFLGRKIPSSVTHLTFGIFNDQMIDKFIPPSATHLTFDQYFFQPLHISASVMEVSLCDIYDEKITCESTITKIIFREH